MIFYPASSLQELSSRLSHWVHNYRDPKTAMHVFVFDFTLGTLHGRAGEPQMVAIIFDAHGEEHARHSEGGFKWALEIEGAREETREMDLSGVHDLQRNVEHSHGTARSWLQAALIDDDSIDEEILVRCWDWYTNVVKETPQLGLGTFVLLEIMQEVSCRRTSV